MARHGVFLALLVIGAAASAAGARAGDDPPPSWGVTSDMRSIVRGEGSSPAAPPPQTSAPKVALDPALLERVRGIVVERLEVDPAKVTPASRLTEDLGADNLGRVDLIVGLEEAFAVKIPEEAWAQMATVGDVAGVVQAQVGRAGR
jgi:acyl carrier protein